MNEISLNLQGGEDQQQGEVDLDDHVDEVLHKDLGQLADDQQEQGGDEDRQDTADQGAPKDNVHHQAQILFIRAEINLLNRILCQFVFASSMFNLDRIQILLTANIYPLRTHLVYLEA